MKPNDVEELLIKTDFVRSLARSVVLDEDSAADISQQALLAALESRPARVRSFKSWLAGVVRNLARFSQREKKNRRVREQRSARPDEVPPAGETAAQEEIRRLVVESVLALKEPYRSTIGLRYLADMPPREVAKKLDVPVETVKTRLKRGLAKLREGLDREFGGDREAWCLALAPLAGLVLKKSSIAAAGAVASGAAASVSHSPLVGAVVMSGKVKACLAAVVLLGAGVAWLVLSDQGSDGEHRAGAEDQTVFSRSEPVDAAASGSAAGESSFSSPEAAPAREKLPAVDGETVAVHGRVLDEDSKPVEGAAIRLGHWEWNYPSALRNIRTEQISWGDRKVASAVDGTFAVTVRKDRLPFTFLDVLKADCVLYEPVALAEAVLEKEKVFFVDDIILSRTYLICGRVLDTSGNPVAGCRVGLNSLPHEYNPQRNATTNGEGAFFLRLKRMRKGFLTAFLEGYGWSISDERVAPGKGDVVPDVTLVLERSRVISGTIFDSDGSAAEGLKLYAQMLIKEKDYVVRLWSQTDGEGRFSFFPAPEGRYTILATIPGCYEVTDSGEHFQDLVLSQEVRAGSEELSFVMPPMASLVLELVDESGAPIDSSDRQISLTFKRRKDDPDYDPEAPDWSHRWTSREPTIDPESGFLRYPRVKQGLYDIRVWHRDYLSQSVEKVTIPAAHTEVRVKVQMQTMRLIRGTVKRPDGTPAPGVKILCEQEEPFSGSRTATASFTSAGLRRRAKRRQGDLSATDQDGGFQFRLFIDHQFPRNIYHLYAILDGREIPIAPPIELSRDHPQEEVVLNLPDLDEIAGRIEGTIIDAKGRPLANALVVAWDGKEFFYRIRSDEEGRFLFSGLLDGSYIVDGRALSRSALGEYRFWDDKDLRKGAETLEKARPFNAVVKEGGTVHLDLRVDDPWNGVLQGVVTSRSGPLPEEIEISLACIREDGRKKEYDTEIESPTAGDLFSWKWDSSRFKDLDPRHDRFRFQDLKAGRYCVGVIMDGKDRFNRNIFNRVLVAGDFVLEPSQTREACLEIGLACIRFEVRDKGTDAPVENARVWLSREQGYGYVFNNNRTSFTTTREGVYVDDLLPEGEYYIYIVHDQYATLQKRGIELHAGQLLDGLILYFEPPCTLKGRVKMPVAPGEKTPHISVLIKPEAWEGKETFARVAADGCFSATHLPPGPVTLTARTRNREPISRVVDLPLSGEEAVLIEFR